MYVCMYACMYVPMYVGMCVCMYVCRVCVFVCVCNVCMYVCMYVCLLQFGDGQRIGAQSIASLRCVLSTLLGIAHPSFTNSRFRGVGSNIAGKSCWSPTCCASYLDCSGHRHDGHTRRPSQKGSFPLAWPVNHSKSMFAALFRLSLASLHSVCLLHLLSLAGLSSMPPCPRCCSVALRMHSL